MKIIVKKSERISVAGENFKTKLKAYTVKEFDEKIVYSELKTLIVNDIDSTFNIGDEYEVEISKETVSDSNIVLNVSKYKKIETNQELLKKFSDKGKDRLREYLKKYAYVFEENKMIFDLCAFSIKLYLDKLSYSGLKHRMYTGGAIDMLENLTNVIVNFDSDKLSVVNKCISIYLLIVKTIQEIESYFIYGYGFLGAETFETCAYGVNFDMLTELTATISECSSKDKSGIMFFDMLLKHAITTNQRVDSKNRELNLVLGLIETEKSLVQSTEQLLL